mmetsp:Transcript_31328/g.80021  ORF Transcript_31328/g.80021 Transcript_31328/m.80021 type:complete len:353 (+) Transcript_31328:216-1274(+)
MAAGARACRGSKPSKRVPRRAHRFLRAPPSMLEGRSMRMLARARARERLGFAERPRPMEQPIARPMVSTAHESAAAAVPCAACRRARAESASSAGEGGSISPPVEETTQASTMSMPPSWHCGPIVSPSSTKAKPAPHSGSVAKTTVASAEESSPSAADSTSVQPAVVPTPVHSTVPRMAAWPGPKGSARRACTRAASFSTPAPPPAPTTHALVRPSTAISCHAVRAAGVARSLAPRPCLCIAFSHWKKPAPKKSGCSSPTRSPWLGAPPWQMPSSSSAATPVAASAAANQTRRGCSLPSTSASSIGQTRTESARRKACTPAGLVSSAIACAQYPAANHAPITRPSFAKPHCK